MHRTSARTSTVWLGIVRERMFSNRAFESWPLVVIGALLFGSLFTLVAMMTDLVFHGAFRPSSSAVALGLSAFVGYVGVATILRREEKHKTLE